MIFNRKHFLKILIFALLFLPSSVLTNEKNRVLSYQDYVSRGKSYFFEGQADKAIEECNKAIDLDPKNPSAYYIRGYCYNMKAQYEKAIGDMKRGIALDPKGYQTNGILSKFHNRWWLSITRNGIIQTS